MYNQFFNTVLEVLKQDQRFFTDNGELLRNSVYEAAMQMDSNSLNCFCFENKSAFASWKVFVFDKSQVSYQYRIYLFHILVINKNWSCNSRDGTYLLKGCCLVFL